MFRKVVVMFALAVSAVLFAAVPTHASGIAVNVNGQPVAFDGQGPVIVDGRTLVPVRGVFEMLGFAVAWNGDTRQATLSNANYTVVVTIDSATFTVNGTLHTLEVPAQIIGGSTMLPLRAVLEPVGFDLGWQAETQLITVNPTQVAAAAPAPSPIPTPVPTPTPTPAISTEELERRIFEETNRMRVENGVHELIWDEVLARAARAHSEDQATNGFMGHTGSDGSSPLGRIWVARDEMLEEGLIDRRDEYYMWGENVAPGGGNPEGVVRSWMGSPGHRANILNPMYTHFGAGVSESRRYATQKFGLR